MTNINFTYNSGELGWVTGEVPLSGNIALRVRMKSRGYIVIKEVLDDSCPVVEVSPYIEEAEFNICLHKRGGDVRSYKIKVYCSSEPEKIEYANL